MNIVPTFHARERMQSRRISLVDIEAALGNYHTSMPADDGATKYVGEGTSGAPLTVVLLPPGMPADTVHVKTVW